MFNRLALFLLSVLNIELIVLVGFFSCKQTALKYHDTYINTMFVRLPNMYICTDCKYWWVRYSRLLWLSGGNFFFLLVETDYDSVLESGQHLSRAQSQSSKEKMGNSTFAYCTNHIHSLPSLWTTRKWALNRFQNCLTTKKKNLWPTCHNGRLGMG